MFYWPPTPWKELSPPAMATGAPGRACSCPSPLSWLEAPSEIQQLLPSSACSTSHLQKLTETLNQLWIFNGRINKYLFIYSLSIIDTEAEAPILWPSDVKNWLIEEDSEAGKVWRQEKGMTEDEIFGWHHRLNGHEFEQALGVSDGQGSLVCCTPWGHKESDVMEWLNWTELKGWNMKLSSSTSGTSLTWFNTSLPVNSCVSLGKVVHSS